MSKFVSAFKIGGNPILPPLMTNEIRLEMLKYKDLAVIYEKKLKERNTECPIPATSIEEPVNDIFSTSKSTEETTKEHQSKEISYPLESAKALFDTIKEMENIHYIDNSTVKTDSNYDSHEPETNCSYTDDYDTSPPLSNRTSILSKSRNETEDDECIKETAIPKLIRSDSYTMDNPSPMLLKHIMDQGLDVKSIMPDVKSASPISVNSTTNPIPHVSNVPNIPKSRSKIQIDKKINKKAISTTASKEKVWRHKLQVKKPKMKNEFTKKTTAQIVASIYKSKKNSITNLSSNKNSTNTKEPITYALVARKTTVSPITTSTPVTVSNNSNTTVATTTTITPLSESGNHLDNDQYINKSKSTRELKTTLSFSPLASSNVKLSKSEDKILDFLFQIEQNHKNQMAMLLDEQQKEQRKMQASFLRQQEILIHQITTSCSNMIQKNQMKLITPTNLYLQKKSSSTVEPDILDANKNLPSAIERLDIGEHDTDDSTQNEDYFENINISLENNNLCDIEVPTMQHICSRQLFGNSFPIDQVPEDTREIAASTKINAYVRGYLVRRLFKTEDVQAIIKVIRDTLLFILDLHSESSSTDLTAADIKMKKTLLQQLNSGCGALHNIFFNKTTKEKMEIISMDRQWLRRKCSVTSNHSSNPSIDSSKSLHKLKKISLFSVNIRGKENTTKLSTSQSVLGSEKNIQSQSLPKRPKSTA